MADPPSNTRAGPLPTESSTPLGKTATTTIQRSIAINGRHPNLVEFRARIAGDMYTTPVLISENYLLDVLLALPAHVKAYVKRWRGPRNNPFAKDLHDADDIEEAELSSKMVSVVLGLRYSLGCAHSD